MRLPTPFFLPWPISSSYPWIERYHFRMLLIIQFCWTVRKIMIRLILLMSSWEKNMSWLLRPMQVFTVIEWETYLAGFMNKAPQFNFICRKNVVLSIDSDKTDEVELHNAVSNATIFVLTMLLWVNTQATLTHQPSRVTTSLGDQPQLGNVSSSFSFGKLLPCNRRISQQCVPTRWDCRQVHWPTRNQSGGEWNIWQAHGFCY